AQTTFFMITNDVVVEGGFTVSGIDAVCKLDVGVFQEGDHGHQLEGRTGFEQSSGREVELFVKVPLSVGRKIRDSLDLAGLYFHDNDEAIIGIVLVHCIVQSCLRNILEIDIKCGDEVESVDGFNIICVIDRLPDAPGYFLVVSVSILAGELFVKAVFESCTLVILVNETDSATAELGEWIVADVDLFEYGATSQSSLTEDRPGCHHFFVLIVDTFLVQDNILFPRGPGILKHSFVALPGLVSEKTGKAIGQGIAPRLKILSEGMVASNATR